MRPQRERHDAIKVPGWYFYLELIRLAGYPCSTTDTNAEWYDLHAKWLREMLSRSRVREWRYHYEDDLWHCSRAGKPVRLSFPHYNRMLQFRFKRKCSVWSAREELVAQDARFRLEQIA